MTKGIVTQVSAQWWTSGFEPGCLPKSKRPCLSPWTGKNGSWRWRSTSGMTGCGALCSQRARAWPRMAADAGGQGLQVPVGTGDTGPYVQRIRRRHRRRPAAGGEYRTLAHPSESPCFDQQQPAVEILETGIKVIDLLEPYPKGGKIGFVRRAGVVKPCSFRS